MNKGKRERERKKERKRKRGDSSILLLDVGWATGTPLSTNSKALSRACYRGVSKILRRI